MKKKLEKGKKKLLKEKEISILEDKLKLLNKGEDIIGDNDEGNKFLSSIGLLSIKPKIIVCNVDEESVSTGNKYTKSVKEIIPRKKL